MAEIIIISLLLILLAGFLVFKIGDMMAPWTVTVGVWLAILLLFIGYGGTLEPLSIQFLWCVCIWVPILCITAIITYYGLPSSENPTAILEPMQINQGFFMLFYTISLVCTPLYLYEIYKIIAMFGFDDLFFNLRILANSSDGDGLLRYVLNLNQALFIIATWNYQQVGRIKYITILLANMLCAIAIMEKGFMFFLLFVTMFILYEKRKIKLGTILLWSIVIFFAFYAINNARELDNQKEDSNILDFFSMYILSPSVAFGRVQEKLSEQFGTRTFAFFYAFLTKTGLGNFVVEKKLQDFVWVPIPTNVYTVFQPFFQDFGYKGVAFFASVYGVFSGWLYRMCKNGNAISKCLYAYVVEIFILQFYQENLILSLSILFQFLIVVVPVVQNFVHLNFNFRKGHAD